MIEKTDNNYVIEWDIDTKSPTFYKVATMDAANKSLQQVLDNMEAELGIEAVKKEWHSKYNSYVKYDYEPYCFEGFTYKAYYPMGEKTDFMQYLINKRLDDINVLENFYKLREAGTNENKQ